MAEPTRFALKTSLLPNSNRVDSLLASMQRGSIQSFPAKEHAHAVAGDFGRRLFWNGGSRRIRSRKLQSWRRGLRTGIADGWWGVLIHGGAGGIGSFAVQLAKYLGAHVATTVSARDIGYAEALGADTIVDYKSKNFDEVLADLDAVLDTVGGDTYTRSFKPLKTGGRLASMLEQPKQALVHEFGVQASMVFARATTQRLTGLAELVDRMR
jgi:hypothetical protein